MWFRAIALWRQRPLQCLKARRSITLIVDGNKKVDFAAVDVFLRINGWRLDSSPDQIHRDMMQIFDSGTFDIAHLDPWFRTLARPAV